MGQQPGDSIAAAVVEALGLREGDDVILHAAGKRTLEIEKVPGAKNYWPAFGNFGPAAQRFQLKTRGQ